MFARIDHIGVAVEDLDAAIKLYEQTYGMALVHRETIEAQGVEAVLLDVGENHVELLAPLGPETPVGKFLSSPGPRLHPAPPPTGGAAARACTTSPTRRATSRPSCRG